MRGILVELFESYGDDAPAALAAFANVAPVEWARYVDEAAERQYRADRAKHVRDQRLRVSDKANVLQLFSTDDAKSVELRERLVLYEAGKRREFGVLELAGIEGAEIIAKVVKRDERGARTTLTRTATLKKLAKEMVRRSEAEGRPVSAAEILERAS